MKIECDSDNPIRTLLFKVQYKVYLEEQNIKNYEFSQKRTILSCPTDINIHYKGQEIHYKGHVIHV